MTLVSDVHVHLIYFLTDCSPLILLKQVDQCTVAYMVLAIKFSVLYYHDSKPVLRDKMDTQ